jgi:cytochrome c
MRVFVAMLAFLSALGPSSAPRAASADEPRILVFSETAAFRHDSIPAAVEAVRALGAQNGFSVDATEDPQAFTDNNLAAYRAVMFLLTTGNLLDDNQRGAFQRYIEAGNGYVGVHSASDTGYDWPWYGGLVGTYFANHPHIQPAVLHVEDGTHPSTLGLPPTWSRTDEWYDFRTNPRDAPDIHVLVTLDESSYSGGLMGGDHPWSWYHAYDGGRAWYTAGGHTIESYSEDLFLRHLLGGIQYAAGIPGLGQGVFFGGREARGARGSRRGRCEGRVRITRGRTRAAAHFTVRSSLRLKWRRDGDHRRPDP